MSDFIIPDDNILDEGVFDSDFEGDISEDEDIFVESDYDPDEWN